ncbi:cobalamin biosynthesis protein CbiM [Synergistales bacterium]|nr:cobalamin biosynthesis protein CbiM [Synergistales bacterium]
MHMADALLSPSVGGAMTAVSIAAIGMAVKKISKDGLDEKKIPMMGVMGAFVFAAQMINFTIPGTGSSGHIGGGVLLAALLGPGAALIVLASVLLVQCLFFADGGLLAYGCNVFNMGVCACLLSYRCVYQPIAKRGLTRRNIFLASIASVVLGLQVGSFGVVCETFLSGVAELPFMPFLLLMQPIHLAIGLIEGIVTASVLSFIQSARPEIMSGVLSETRLSPFVSMKKVVVELLILTVLIGGGLSVFASSFPDGLEWSIEGLTGSTELERDGAIYKTMGGVVEKVAIMPDYALANGDGAPLETAGAGIVGSVITLTIAGGVGFAVAKLKK